MWKAIGMSMLLLAGQAYGSQEVGCKARQQAVADQLVFAKAHNNADQVAGLERALRNIEAHCTDAGLFKEQQKRVAELKEQVNERLLELQNARVSGKPGKIAKKQAKLEEAQTRLLAAQNELDALSKLITP